MNDPEVVVGAVLGRLVVLKVDGIDVVCRCSCGAEKTLSFVNISSKKGARSCGCLRREKTRLVGLATRRHGMHLTPTYRSWRSMKYRCLNPKAKPYPRYGGRGIKVCERWLRFENFLEDMGECPPNLTIDRIDNDGDYEPGNCRWAGRKTQMRNRSCTLLVEWKGKQTPLSQLCEERGIPYQTAYARLTDGLPIEKVLDRGKGCFFRDNNPKDRHLTYNGQTKRMKDWASEFGIKIGTLSYRIRNGWSVESALTTPVQGATSAR